MRILVLHDDTTEQGWLAPRLASHDDLVVLGSALFAEDAGSRIVAAAPQVVVLDLHGATAEHLQILDDVVRRRRAHVVVVQSKPDCGDEFLAAGALAAFSRPASGEDPKAWLDALLRALRAAAGVQPIRGRPREPAASREGGRTACDLVGVGASTGGPASLQRILSCLEPQPCPILIVVHTTASSIEHLRDWLQRDARMPLVIAEARRDLDSLRGHVVLAPHDRHVVVRDDALALTLDPPRNFVRPSIDVLFDSLASSGRRPLGVLLTGMGRDGASGLGRMRLAGGRTLVQDQATSAVFGMPAAAIAEGAAERVLPDVRIADAIARLCRVGPTSGC